MCLIFVNLENVNLFLIEAFEITISIQHIGR